MHASVLQAIFRFGAEPHPSPLTLPPTELYFQMTIFFYFTVKGSMRHSEKEEK